MIELHGAWKRNAWLLGDVTALAAPVPCTGRQGLFDLPAEVESAVRAQNWEAA